MKIELKIIPADKGGKRWMIFDGCGYLHFMAVAKDGEIPSEISEELLRLSLRAGEKRQDAAYWEK